MLDWLLNSLQVSNQVVTATTVIIAASLMFYNLSHGIRDRVVRASSLVLGCVVAVYIGSVFLALGFENPVAHFETWLRFRWLGIAFMPAALFHLSDALLETTGVASRGRRRRILRLLYVYATMFFVLAAMTDVIVQNPTRYPVPAFQAGSLWLLYLIYVGVTLVVSFNNVLRARRRCLTPVTHRRMTYLLLTFLMPAIGTFPYTVFVPPSPDHLLLVMILINVGNLGITLMLAFMAYPLAFFGQNRPDRVIKRELLRFMLRGPLTGIIVLAVIVFMPAATHALRLPGVDFLPFVAVAAVLLVQWAIALALPTLDRFLVFPGDQDQARQLQELSEHLLTPTDARQQLAAILAALCDYLRSSSGFIVSFDTERAQLESVIGAVPPSKSWLASPEFLALADLDVINTNTDDPDNGMAPPAGFVRVGELMAWQSFWLLPLHNPRSRHATEADESQGRLIGLLGLLARAPQPDLKEDEQAVLSALCRRAGRVLDDLRLQTDIFATLQGLLPEMDAVQSLPGTARYGDAPALARSSVADDIEPLADEAKSELTELIHEAMRDYWGGPRLTEGRLLALNVVKQALVDNDGNPARAVRAVLKQAIESLRPAGLPRKTAEWTLYNVLEMRFVQGKKVSEVADSLSMSAANIYRKQRFAIEQVARQVALMERDSQKPPPAEPESPSK